MVRQDVYAGRVVQLRCSIVNVLMRSIIPRTGWVMVLPKNGFHMKMCFSRQFVMSGQGY